MSPKIPLIQQIPKADLQAIVRQRDVSDNEFEALYLALSGESNREIAAALGITDPAVRKRLGEAYRKFEIAGKGPGKLEKLKHELVAQYEGKRKPSIQFRDWGEAPSISEFYGRSEELATLKQWMVDDNCRLIAVLGMGGIGKTTLVRRLAAEIEDRFEFIIWRSLATAPSLSDLLGEILTKLSPSLDLPAEENAKIDALLNPLQQHSCLLVLDETEAILKEGDRYGRYREGYQNYGDFFKRVGQTDHQSNLVLISQEPPLDLIRLEKATTTVRSQTLTGLELDAATQILQQQNCTGKQKDYQHLATSYRGNPLYLKLVAVTIQEIFQGNIEKFTKLETIVIPESVPIEPLYNRLSLLEQEILTCLATQDSQLSLPQIKDCLSNTSFSEIIESMESLKKRSLLEQTEKKKMIYFSLQPVIKKYIKRDRANS